MQYFDTLPKLIKTDDKGNSLLLTNILARANLLQNFLSSPAIYYEYDIQDGDTPEIIAHKYYGDVYRYWVVLFANQIIDPQWQWPMIGDVFKSYIDSKYTLATPAVNPYTTVHHYEKQIDTLDISTNITTTNKISISQNTYNSLTTSTTNYSLATGTVKVTISKNLINIYNYELQLNEDKRSIKILKNNYVGQLEKQLKSLMSQ
jgi:ABC-type antimicrobial peptide transport system permease subunit